MHVVITGAAGFLGQRLARKLLQNDSVRSLALADIIPPPGPTHPKVKRIQADLTNPQAAKDIIHSDTTTVYHLAAVVSGQAEANFDLGIKVNCDGTRHLLEAIRHQAPGAKFIFASSLAVFGGNLPDTLFESTAVTPQSSYGTQKAICELWANDYARKGFVDSRILRLPTVCVRPGKPNAAASSFASSIIREPLNNETAICPVNPNLQLWLSSPNAVTNNLIHAMTIEARQFGPSRTVNLPGITVSVQEMIDSLHRIAGADTAQRIRYKPNEAIAQIVESWPAKFDTSRATNLGFSGNRTFDDIIKSFINENPNQ